MGREKPRKMQILGKDFRTEIGNWATATVDEEDEDWKWERYCASGWGSKGKDESLDGEVGEKGKRENH